jgi:hypothetical protein
MTYFDDIKANKIINLKGDLGLRLDINGEYLIQD